MPHFPVKRSIFSCQGSVCTNSAIYCHSEGFPILSKKRLESDCAHYKSANKEQIELLRKANNMLGKAAPDSDIAQELREFFAD